jgi:type IV pilus assembly protein PilB
MNDKPNKNKDNINEVKFVASHLSTPTSKLTSFNYEETPITEIVNQIILDAIRQKASDIHFDPHEDGLKIRIRIDGKLSDYSVVPLYVQKNMVTRIKIISGMNITETRVPQDGAIKNSLDNVDVDLRVSCLPTNLGEKIVIRILDYKMSSAGIESLNFSKTNLEKVLKMINIPNGIILVTGATGTGKSTTVYSILQRLNTEDRNIITVEDPIEMNIEGINQVQVVSEIGLTFASALRSILRQDPDIIMIGEIRDDETARIAVRASITGHLVLSTIHTNNSLNTIERLTDMEVERYLLGAALSGIISQKLARRLCMKCRRARKTTDYEKKVFKSALDIDVNEIYEPVGCDDCHQGYAGRIAIHEVLLINQEIRDAIVRNTDKEVLRNLVYSSGTITMLQDGLEKVVAGETTFEEIIKLIDLEDDLGSNTNLGLKQTLEDSNQNNHTADYDTLD